MRLPGQRIDPIPAQQVDQPVLSGDRCGIADDAMLPDEEAGAQRGEAGRGRGGEARSQVRRLRRGQQRREERRGLGAGAQLQQAEAVDEENADTRRVEMETLRSSVNPAMPSPAATDVSRAASGRSSIPPSATGDCSARACRCRGQLRSKPQGPRYDLRPLGVLTHAQREVLGGHAADVAVIGVAVGVGQPAGSRSMRLIAPHPTVNVTSRGAAPRT